MIDTKKILFLTGTRADFGKIRPLASAVEALPGFECYVFATGMHMLSKYGYTFMEIEKAGFRNIFPYINQIYPASGQMDLVLASTIEGLGRYLRETAIDLIVVHGDRVETLAGAIVGALNNTLVAHIEGGELSGTVDELIRHSVSKLSHLHFVANGEARRRLIQMGEVPNSIYVIGSPDIDVMFSDDLPGIPAVKDKYDIDFSEYAVFIYHPVTTEMDTLRGDIETVISALQDSDWNFVVLYPNNDLGTDVILQTINTIRGELRFRILPSMRFEYFLSLLRHSRAIVGNSSAGIREAPVYGVPTINIGSRQMNRFEYSSIVNVPADREAILQAMANLPVSVTPSDHFGKGNSTKAFMKALESPNLWTTPKQKKFRDLPDIARRARELKADGR
jgi:UDP-N-acetylglucosamine 2-epimerase (hydrolysing)